MSVQDFNTYMNLLNGPAYILRDQKSSLATVIGQTFSSWTNTPNAGVVPTTATGTFGQTPGALGTEAGVTLMGMNSTASLYPAYIHSSQGQLCSIMLIDRLVEQGGMSAITLNAQANLPMRTDQQTRYTSSYVGQYAALEIYTQIGATSALVSGSYVNQNGSTSSFQATNFGNTNYRSANRFIILPLQDGDTGVQNVLSISISISTGTAGNYGVTLFKPLMMWSVPQILAQSFVYEAITTNGSQLPAIQNNACLQYVFLSNTTSTGGIINNFRFIAS